MKKESPAAALGKLGGAVKSKAKSEAARANGLRGGRPRAGLLAVRVDREFYEEVCRKAETLGMTTAALVNKIIRDHIHEY